MKALVTQLCLTLCNPTDCSPPGSSVQARILEWVAIPFFRGLSEPRDWTYRKTTFSPFCKSNTYWEFLGGLVVGIRPFTSVAWIQSLSGNWDTKRSTVAPHPKVIHTQLCKIRTSPQGHSCTTQRCPLFALFFQSFVFQPLPERWNIISRIISFSVFPLKSSSNAFPYTLKNTL